MESPSQIEPNGNSCDPIVTAGKEVPQKMKYYVDEKRSFGKPGATSNRSVHWKYCEIDTILELPGQPHDCADILANGVNVSGVYTISPEGNGPPFNVYCDMDTDGGGWTVVQRRKDGSVNFNHNWLDYKHGFGTVSSEHWLGNEKIHRLTAHNSYELRVDLEDFERQTSYAVYSRFIVQNETSNYTLSLGTYSGKAGDKLGYSNQCSFSTPDRNTFCAKSFASGWWFKDCFTALLNGIYHSTTGVYWQRAFGIGPRYYDYGVLKACDMKIRPTDVLHHVV